ncbi:hypothetical protein ACFWOJ_32360 [Streptomyces sp. NPDC058439]|uniref:hypothetical protein n=1 Tax=Streptomyces sp. NPDC058439 TaxID=3346500 RepID=UPI0036630E50
MRYLEGSPEEIAEFLRLTDGKSDTATDTTPETAEVTATGTDMTSLDIGAFIDQRGRSSEGNARVYAYIKRVRSELGGVDITTGQSERTRDGQSDYLMVHNDGKRRFGAVAYVKPANSGLTLRLTHDDVADVPTKHIQFRAVRAGHQYVINCPLTSDEAIECAVELTKRALDKVRR